MPKLGAAGIDAVYLGGSVVDKIYLGSNAVYTAIAPPSQVTGLAVDSTGDGTIDLSWSAPASDAAITDYRVEYTPSGGSATEVLVGSNATSYQLTGLTNDTEYSVRVAAISAGGQGDYSAAVTGTPSAVSFVEIPQMTSNTAPSGTVLTFGAVKNGFLQSGVDKAWYWFSRGDFRGNNAAYAPVNPSNTGIGYQFDGAQSLISGFEIAQSGRYDKHYAIAFEFSGSDDGSNWTVLSTHSGLSQSDWPVEVVKTFSLPQPVAYSHYRWIINSPSGYVEWTKVQLRP